MDGQSRQLRLPGQGDDNAFGSFPNHWEKIFRNTPLADITPHVLRHSFASIANDLGFTEVTIAALVGHAKGSVTSKYIHTLDTALIMAADTISGYIQGLLDGLDFKQTAYALDRDSQGGACSFPLQGPRRAVRRRRAGAVPRGLKPPVPVHLERTTDMPHKGTIQQIVRPPDRWDRLPFCEQSVP